MTVPAIFEKTLHDTMEWLKALEVPLGPITEQQAYAALRAVLHQLRDRLPDEEATDLAAQLPLLVRGIYYETYNPSKTPEKIRHLEPFLAALGEKLSGHPELDPEAAARAVFALLAEKVSPGEISDVVNAMPDEIKTLWPDAARDAAARKHGRAG